MRKKNVIPQSFLNIQKFISSDLPLLLFYSLKQELERKNFWTVTYY